MQLCSPSAGSKITRLSEKSWTTGKIPSLSLSMSGREMPSANARQQKREGTITVPVFIGPDEFFSFCMRRKIPLNKTTRPEFANSRGAASYSMGM